MTRELLFLMNAEQALAFARLVEAANRGDGAAACTLGDTCREGLGGLRYSPKQACRWYAKSALAGDANGQNNLGACCEHGLGCAQSYRSAVKWYRLSAAQGLGTAAMNLGYCYLRGHGVPADKEEALRLFRLAAERGEERAAIEVERMQSDRGLRVAQPVPADTQRARPCVLALGSVPRDGPQKQLCHPDVAPAESTEDRAAIATPATTGIDECASVPTGDCSELVVELLPEEHPAMVGMSGDAPVRPRPAESSAERRTGPDGQCPGAGGVCRGPSRGTTPRASLHGCIHGVSPETRSSRRTVLETTRDAAGR